MIGPNTGWGREEFFVFLGTTWIVNSIVQAFFMPNANEFSELIRTGNLDFALLKPIDTQFLISFTRIEWSSLANLAMGIGLLIHALIQLAGDPTDPSVPTVWAVLLYPFYIACGVAILYGSMISLAATSVWLGRNRSLYDFWFYLTNFYRHPMEIFQRGRFGSVALHRGATDPRGGERAGSLAGSSSSPSTIRGSGRSPLTALAAVVALVVSRWVFQRAALLPQQQPRGQRHQRQEPTDESVVYCRTRPSRASDDARIDEVFHHEKQDARLVALASHSNLPAQTLNAFESPSLSSSVDPPT
ncbi:MAG: ABC-2 family transporter protein [Pirellulaceae bacterium]